MYHFPLLAQRLSQAVRYVRMSKLSSKVTRRVSQLAKLTLKTGEIVKFRSQLSNIFDYVDQIKEMKTKGVVETSQVTGITNRFRKDKVRLETMLTQKEALSNTKKSHKGYFLVKAIFEE